MLEELRSEAGCSRDEGTCEIYYSTGLYVVENEQIHHPPYYAIVKVSDVILKMEIDTGEAMPRIVKGVTKEHFLG